ncbi:MAG: hypothetical protein ACI4SL_02850 [Candidatus Ornithospirochaeta sp.]
MEAQLIFYLSDKPFASLSTTLSSAIVKKEAMNAVRRLESIFIGEEVNCALRTEDGYLFFGRDGILAPNELEEWNDNRRSKESTTS